MSHLDEHTIYHMHSSLTLLLSLTPRHLVPVIEGPSTPAGGDENGNTGGGAPHAPAILMPKRTFQPHNNRKIKRHGFAKR